MSTTSTEPKEWFKVTQNARGDVSVTCTIQDGNLSVKWTVKAYVTSIKDGVASARKGAYKALDDIKAALRQIGTGS